MSKRRSSDEDQAKDFGIDPDPYPDPGTRMNCSNMSWNGIFSQSFTVENGVRRGGVVSPVLYCLYIDGLLQRLRDSGGRLFYRFSICWCASVCR